MPASALVHLVEAIEEQDDIGRFVRECCQPGGSTPGGLLYQSFVTWCAGNAIRQPPNNTRFGRRLTEMGYPADKKDAKRPRGLTVRTAFVAQMAA
jgi:phage/plasmid-associated DNA primase